MPFISNKSIFTPSGTVFSKYIALELLSDLPEYVESTVHLFTDNTVLYLTMNSQNSCLQLQTDLNNLKVWEQDWLMSFNPEKCEILRVYRKTPFLLNYTLHRVPLKTVPNIKYLGVLLSHDLKWNTHISKMTAKGYRTLGFLRRNLRVNSPTLKAKAYASILRPQLEYCSTVWDPRKGVENSGSYNLEMVQRRATRWAYQQPASVTEMLNELNWRTLVQRRVDARLTMLCRIINNLVEVNPGDNLRSPTHRSRHVHDHSFIPISTSTTSHRLSFYPRTIVQWNSLPPGVFTLSADPAQFRINVSKITHQLV